jgi:hypothetical protein
MDCNNHTDASEDHLGFLREGFLTLTASQAAEVIRNGSYDKQRSINNNHCLALSKLMQSGQWMPKDKLDFALFEGRISLINGHHRMIAQSMSGAAIEWTVAIHKCNHLDEVRNLYACFDVNVRKRTAENILQGLDFQSEFGLSKTAASGLYKATSFIIGKFDVARMRGNVGDADERANARLVNYRIAVAREFGMSMRLLEELLEPAPAAVSALLKKQISGATAVALVTLRHQNEIATEFWGGIAKNDGLKRGDPRSAFLTDIQNRTFNRGISSQSYVAATRAWNAYFEKKELFLIRVTSDYKSPILGTPYSVTA